MVVQTFKANEIDISKIKFTEISKDIKNNHHVSIKYEVNGVDVDLWIDTPLVRTDYSGTIERENEGGGKSHSMKFMFPRFKPTLVSEYDDAGEIVGGHYEEPEQVTTEGEVPPIDYKGQLVDNTYTQCVELCDVLDSIRERAVDYLFANKNKFGNLFSQMKQRPLLEASFKPLVFRRTVSAEDDLEDMKYPPSLYVKFIESGPNNTKNPNRVFTKFVGLDKKLISHTQLMGVVAHLTTSIKIEKIFLGNTKSLQCKIIRAVVWHTISADELSQDMTQVNEIIESNPAAAAAFIRNWEKTNKKPEVSDEKLEVIKKEPEEELDLNKIMDVGIKTPMRKIVRASK